MGKNRKRGNAADTSAGPDETNADPGDPQPSGPETTLIEGVGGVGVDDPDGPFADMAPDAPVASVNAGEEDEIPPAPSAAAARNVAAIPVDHLSKQEILSELERLKDLDSETQGLARELADLRQAYQEYVDTYNRHYNAVKVKKLNVDMQRAKDQQRVRHLSLALDGIVADERQLAQAEAVAAAKSSV